MNNAGRIVLLAGTTQWIMWELRAVIELGFVRKLIILFPSKTKSNFGEQYLDIRSAFKGSEWAPAVECVLLNNVRCIAFSDSNGVVAVHCKSRSRNADRFAVLLADYVTTPAVVPTFDPSPDPRAGTASRRLAFAINAILLVSVMSSLLMPLFYRDRDGWWFLMAGIVVIVWVSYFVISDLLGGSVGYLVCGIRAVTESNARPSVRDAILRALFAFLPSGYFYNFRRSISGTLIVKASHAVNKRAICALLWLVIVAFGSAIGSAVYRAEPTWLFVGHFKRLPRADVAEQFGKLQVGNMHVDSNFVGLNSAINVRQAHRPMSASTLQDTPVMAIGN